MSRGDLITEIKTGYTGFTKAERKIADFILSNPKKVLFMSITDLADLCNVGETSVFRFCRSLDLKGYQEFKLTLAQSVVPDGNSALLDVEISENDSTEDVAKKVLASNISVLNDTLKMINYDDINKVVKYIEEANKIAFFGVGGSLITAMEAANKFMRITGKTTFTMDSHLQTMMAALLTPKDLAIVISHSGSTRDIVDIASVCRARGTKTIAITHYAKSPLTVYSDLTLICGANEGPLQGGSISSKISQLYLLDILYMEYFKRNFEQASAGKKLTSAAVTDKLY